MSFYALNVKLGKSRWLVLSFILLANVNFAVYSILTLQQVDELNREHVTIECVVIEANQFASYENFILEPVGKDAEYGKIHGRIYYDMEADFANSLGLDYLSAGSTVMLSGEIEKLTSENEKYAGHVDYANSEGVFYYTDGKVTAIENKYNLLSYLATYREALGMRAGGGIVSAILSGNKIGLDEYEYRLFQDSGLMHMLTFSGAHFAALIFAVEAIFSQFAIEKRRKVGLLIAITVFTMLFMGLTQSVLRAGLMMLIRYIGILLFRKSDGLTLLSLAVFLIIFTKPYLIVNISLVLTTMSVLSILIFGKAMNTVAMTIVPFSSESKIAKAIANSIGTSFSSQILLIPFLYAAFGIISMYSIVSNVLLFSAFIVFFFFGIILVLVYDVRFLWTAIYMFVMEIEALILNIMKFVVALPNSILYDIDMSFVLMYFAMILISTIAVLAYKKNKLNYHMTAISIVAVFLVWTVCVRDIYDGMTVAFFNVGDGDSCVIVNNDRAFVVDIGSKNVYDEEIVLDIKSFLAQQAIDEVEAIFITQMDRAHADAVSNFIEEFPTKAIVYPKNVLDVQLANYINEVAERREVEVKYTQDHTVYFEDGDFSIALIWKHIEEIDGEESVMVLASRHYSSLLIAGDSSYKAYDYLHENGLMLDVDILKVSNHGALHHSSPQFLNFVSPRIAVISVDGEDVNGNPSDDVLERLQHFTKHVYRTDLHGEIIIKTNGYDDFVIDYEGG